MNYRKLQKNILLTKIYLLFFGIFRNPFSFSAVENNEVKGKFF
jgi:hypothetical protein